MLLFDHGRRARHQRRRETGSRGHRVPGGAVNAPLRVICLGSRVHVVQKVYVSAHGDDIRLDGAVSGATRGRRVAGQSGPDARVPCEQVLVGSIAHLHAAGIDRHGREIPSGRVRIILQVHSVGVGDHNRRNQPAAARPGDVRLG